MFSSKKKKYIYIRFREPNNLLGPNKVKGKTIEYMLGSSAMNFTQTFLNHNPMG